MSAALDQADRFLGTIQRREASVVLLAGRHGAVADHPPVAFVVITEKAGGKIAAAAMSLTASSVDPHLHGTFPSLCAQRRIKVVN
jgi:hypothetical protein